MPDGYWPNEEVCKEIQSHGIELINAYDAAEWHLSQFCEVMETCLRKSAQIEAEEEARNVNDWENYGMTRQTPSCIGIFVSEK